MSRAIDSVASRNSTIISTDLDDIVVMMDPDKGMYYELDPIAAQVWRLIETGRSVAEVCDVLMEEYDVTPDVCRRDVLAWLAKAAEQGIIELRAPAAR